MRQPGQAHFVASMFNPSAGLAQLPSVPDTAFARCAALAVMYKPGEHARLGRPACNAQPQPRHLDPPAKPDCRLRTTTGPVHQQARIAANADVASLGSLALQVTDSSVSPGSLLFRSNQQRYTREVVDESMALCVFSGRSSVTAGVRLVCFQPPKPPATSPRQD